jgi:hypothetical protein
VHDPLYARAIVLERGGLELALVAVDLVGLQYGEIRKIQEKMEGFDPRHVIIASTHNHNGPDTMGFWGLPPLFSGIDSEVMKKVEAGILEALQRARAGLREAEVAAGVVLAPENGLIKNLRRPGMVDRQVVVLHVRERGGGETIATLVELGCHPEVLGRDNHLITADFPHMTVKRVEESLGGVGIYVSGAVGGLVTPDVERPEPADPVVEWRECERVGAELGELAVSAVRGIEREYSSSPELEVWHAPLYIKSRNFRYDVARWMALLERELYSGYLRTEVNLWRIGDLSVATVPGEITPDLGLRIKHLAGPGPVMLVGLANDELGYLLPETEYDLPIYRYERGLCPAREAGERIVRRIEDLVLLGVMAGSR